jgi:hypothetical protein
MNVNIFNDYIKLNQILKKLEDTKEPLNEKALDKVINNVMVNIVQLINHNQPGVISQTEGLTEGISEVLVRLAHQLEFYNNQNSSINDLVQDILSVRTTLEHPPPVQEKKVKSN